jgi:2-dehydro-3-deoxyphosphogluconate aldolase/(4S)-4-hydroxy-2-oxoglutarate aldolase
LREAPLKKNVDRRLSVEREQTLKKIRELGLIAVVRGESRDAAIDVSSALIEGGISGVEIAFTTPEAHLVIEDLSKEYGGRVLLGAGTVVTAEQVEQSFSAGATFLVSPGCDPELVVLMQQTDLAVLPGTLTPSDIMLAQRLGLKVIKLFPGSLGGPPYLKNLLGPFPEMEFLPTGGVSLENVGEWFEAGAFAVGVGGALVPAKLGKERERHEVITRAEQFVNSTRAALNGV